MKEYELITTSNPYTFLAEDFETAALTVRCFGQAYSAKSKDNSEVIPIFLLGDAEEWYARHFNRTPEEGLKAKKTDVVKALNSMMFGGHKDRRRYNAALQCITDPVKKRQFIEIWQEGRSSLNNVGKAAHNMAKKISAG